MFVLSRFRFVDASGDLGTKTYFGGESASRSRVSNRGSGNKGLDIYHVLQPFQYNSYVKDMIGPI